MTSSKHLTKTNSLSLRARRLISAAAGRTPIKRILSNKLGVLFGTLFFWISLAPSILPRPWWTQSLLSGIMLSVGWLIGYAIKSVVRFFSQDIKLDIKFTKRSSSLIKASALAFSVYSLWQSARWQLKLSSFIFGYSRGLSPLLFILIVGALSLSLAIALISIGSAVKRLILKLSTFFARLPIVRRIPKEARTFLGYLIIVVFLFQASSGAFHIASTRIGNKVFSAKNKQTPSQISPPTSNLVTGGPESLISWDSLGRQGKKFVASTPSQEEIKLSTGSDSAKQPIRIYSNLDPSGKTDLAAQLDATMQEVQRTGALTRKYLLLVITTGTGWVDTQNTAPLEYLAAGDVATVAIQYSYYPSWLSLMTDRQKAQQAAQESFSRIYAAREAIDPSMKPKLLLFGESLGSYGAESIFKDPQELTEKVDGAVFVGPTGFNRIFNQVVESKANPFNDSRLNSEIHIITNPDDYNNLSSGTKPKVFYLTNPTDPVGIWSPSLIWQNPERLQKNPSFQKEGGQWFPIATFFQTTVDLASGVKVPPGYGHMYGSSASTAWNLLTSN